MIRGFVEQILRWRGYELKPIAATPMGFDGFLERVNRSGLRPSTVLDVGVGPGTPWLYSAFPDAKLMLFEPLDKFEPDLKKICGSRNGEYHIVALGGEEKNAEIYIPERATGASLKPRSGNWIASRNVKTVETTKQIRVVPLDSLCHAESPYVLKIDAEGSEVDVLRGATRVLTQTDLVLAEAAVMPRHEADSMVGDIVKILDQRGFDLLEIVETTNIRTGGALAYMDVAFARRGTPFQRAYWNL
jgi:FkbM family methyltransferase